MGGSWLVLKWSIFLILNLTICTYTKVVLNPLPTEHPVVYCEISCKKRAPLHNSKTNIMGRMECWGTLPFVVDGGIKSTGGLPQGRHTVCRSASFSAFGNPGEHKNVVIFGPFTE